MNEGEGTGEPGEGEGRHMKEITVVIPNYNGKKYLAECLMALCRQEPGTPEFEIIVVDNGSTDGSTHLLVELWPDVRKILLKENTGFCHAVNLGIQAADSPYVILLNNDTKAGPGFVKGLYRAIEKDEGIFSVSAKMLMWDRPELVDDAGDYYCALGWAFGRGKGKPAERYGKPVQVFSACGGAAIYRREVFGEIGLFDETHFAYLEDLDIGYRARIHGYRNYYEPSAQVLHFGSASTGSRYNEQKTLLSSANNVYVVGKNMPLFQVLVNLPFLCAGYFIKFLFFARKGMGGLYLKGLCRGLGRCFGEDGRGHRVAFRWRNLGNYLGIQLELWGNLFRLLDF